MSSESESSFAAALSTAADTHAAAEEVCGLVRQELNGVPQLAMLFVSPHHLENSAALVTAVCDRLEPDVLLGCTGESIVGPGIEVELEPAVSLWAARLPQVQIRPLQLDFQRTPEGGSIVGWPDDLPDDWPTGATLILVGDPFSFPADLLLEVVNDEHPNVPVVGGMASAGHEPGSNRLFLGRQAFSQGAVAVLLHGAVDVRTVVSQGCRPIGQPFVITKAERNVISELGGLPAYRRLEEVFQTLPTRDQRLVQRGLHVGRVVSEYQDQFEQGDFLVRNVVGVDPEQGAIAIGDYVRPGQTVQFHVRDAETADAELRQLLAGLRDASSSAASGALLFTCNGRGTRLFAEPHHDAAAIQQTLGTIPLSGFFAAGELGPIGGSNFVHGFTASIAVFG